MNIILNGEEYEYHGVHRLKFLLSDLGVDDRRVAVVINGQVIPLISQCAHPLSDGDHVDVLTMAGGG